MEFNWTEIGGFTAAVGIVLYIVREVWKMVSETQARKNGKDEPESTFKFPAGKLSELTEKIGELHSWHNVFDDDGVRIWYIRRSIYEALKQSAQALERISLILPSITENQKQMQARLEQIQREMHKSQS